jgi:hypothetical protein
MKKNHLTETEHESLCALILLHAQKVTDYTHAAPNAAMARRHRGWVELLRKAQALLHGEPASCAGCLREGKPDSVCAACGRSPALSDNFKRRST